MTTAQIIIFLILGILDFYQTIIYPILKNRFEWVITVGFIRMLCVWTIMLTLCLSYNDSKGKCPEYQKLENVYQLKN